AWGWLAVVGAAAKEDVEPEVARRPEIRIAQWRARLAVAGARRAGVAPRRKLLAEDAGHAAVAFAVVAPPVLPLAEDVPCAPSACARFLAGSSSVRRGDATCPRRGPRRLLRHPPQQLHKGS